MTAIEFENIGKQRRVNDDVSVVMRGVAIVGIVMHNWLHCCGFAKENEHTFDIKTSLTFWNNLGCDGVAHTIADLISFIGWVGIFVFMFLSGYGLEKKYGLSNLKAAEFLCKQWKKLFFLMILGVLFFVLKDWNQDGWKYLFSLTMLGNVIGNSLMPVGVYWYFGLTFEFYVLWLLLRKLNVLWLYAVGVLMLLIQALMIDTEWCYYVKYNFVGWGQVFVVGMIAGRCLKNMAINDWWLHVIAIVGTTGIFLCNFNKWCWLVVLPFLSVVVIWSVSRLMIEWKYSRMLGIWVGRLSPFLFACHPIVRSFLLGESMANVNWILKCLMYVAFTVILSVCYEKIYRKIV